MPSSVLTDNFLLNVWKESLGTEYLHLSDCEKPVRITSTPLFLVSILECYLFVAEKQTSQEKFVHYPCVSGSVTSKKK